MQVLIETRMNSLRLNESKAPKKGCLGRLEGVCADFKNPTRNGRLYPLQLWKKVFDDPLFKEALQNKTLFGELDHPEDRFEPLVKHACIVMTDYSIDEDKGLVYGGFDILDTPDGRVLKNILDYGSVLGVSSRGQGDIIEDAGGERVDEDSYDFACFDVVSTPAVEKARQKVVESMKREKKETFKESIERQIEDAESAADLNIIRSVVRASGLNDSDMDTIIESIEDKCKALKTSEDTILEDKCKTEPELQVETISTKSAKTIRENRKLYKCINGLRQQVSALKHRENRYVESLNEKDKQLSEQECEITELLNKVKTFKTNERKNLYTLRQQSMELESVTEKFDRKLSNSGRLLENNKAKVTKLLKENTSLKDNVNSLEDENSRLSDELQDSTSKISMLQEQLNNYKSQLSCLENELNESDRSHTSEINSIDAEVDEYSRLLSEAQQRIKDSDSQISELTESLDNVNNSLSAEKAIRSKLEESLSKYQKCYTDRICNVNGIEPESIYHNVSLKTSPQQIDKIVESYRKKLDRYGKLGITLDGLSTGDNYIVENLKTTKDSAEVQEQNNLISFLQTTASSL